MGKFYILILLFFFSCSEKEWKGKSHFENIKQVQSSMSVEEVLNIMGPPDTCLISQRDTQRQFELIWYTPMLAAGHIYVIFNSKDSIVDYAIDGN